eukprot:7293335-Prymnesium_polylepis.2
MHEERDERSVCRAGAHARARAGVSERNASFSTSVFPPMRCGKLGVEMVGWWQWLKHNWWWVGDEA